MMDPQAGPNFSGNGTVLDFYFEFSSPYAYFASLNVEALCARHGLELAWKPIMLGGIFKHTGAKPLLGDGMRGEYATMDCQRWARRHGIPFQLPSPFPVNSLKAARGVLHFRDRSCLAPYIHACFHACWADGRDLFEEGTMADIVAGLGEEVEEFSAAIAAPEIKQRLIAETETARLRGVFGAPTFFYGDEMVWGNDRMGLLEELIAEDLQSRAVGG
ncbi:MAG: 2-hydroxychromene-2-carboxylate isomerase [SAR324 cluster bacterium]|nr:2-hydroxychromene-2-carboxylate isomerase [SAR324 cluster bacterium]